MAMAPNKLNLPLLVSCFGIPGLRFEIQGHLAGAPCPISRAANRRTGTQVRPNYCVRYRPPPLSDLPSRRVQCNSTHTSVRIYKFN
ncbi:hypothetical protein HZ326_20812 [Fusarium oxysporum f. sp. albedinis]|nr:hypothetical protein HZ326_20812 [Fusarium oxysporum f. sp. albedinis]